MERKLTEEMEAQLSMAMRVVQFLKNNIGIVKDNSEMMECFNQMQSVIQTIVEQLDEEELNIVLERYKDELDFLRKENPGLSI